MNIQHPTSNAQHPRRRRDRTRGAVLVVAAVVVLAGCERVPPTVVEQKEEVPPTYLKNLAVKIARYDSDTGKAGDVVFHWSDRKPFVEFGPGALTDRDGNPKDNPTFEYHVDHDAKVYAAADGEVEWVDPRAADDDFALHIKASDGRFTIIYDHVTDPRVEEGEKVMAGDTLGKPGPKEDEYGRTELQVNMHREGQRDISVCPFTFFDPARTETYQRKIEKLMDDWEDFKDDDDIYDQEDHVYPGCITETVVP